MYGIPSFEGCKGHEEEICSSRDTKKCQCGVRRRARNARPGRANIPGRRLVEFARLDGVEGALRNIA